MPTATPNTQPPFPEPYDDAVHEPAPPPHGQALDLLSAEKTIDVLDADAQALKRDGNQMEGLISSSWTTVQNEDPECDLDHDAVRLGAIRVQAILQPGIHHEVIEAEYPSPAPAPAEFSPAPAPPAGEHKLGQPLVQMVEERPTDTDTEPEPEPEPVMETRTVSSVAGGGRGATEQTTMLDVEDEEVVDALQQSGEIPPDLAHHHARELGQMPTLGLALARINIIPSVASVIRALVLFGVLCGLFTFRETQVVETRLDLGMLQHQTRDTRSNATLDDGEHIHPGDGLSSTLDATCHTTTTTTTTTCMREAAALHEQLAAVKAQLQSSEQEQSDQLAQALKEERDARVRIESTIAQLTATVDKLRAQVAGAVPVSVAKTSFPGDTIQQKTTCTHTPDWNNTEEAKLCQCRECADEPVGGDLCASYGPVTPCECEDSSGSSDPVRQTYPMTQSDPPCCREEWPAAPTVTQATTSSPQVFDEDDIMVRIGGQVTFAWTGFENVEQVSDFDSYTPVSDGIRSGDPTSAGSFTHTFDTAGEYYLRSYVHESLQVKVTVMECVSCIAVAGYDGANPATLALALSSRAAGDFALAISSAGMARVMTLLTVYDGQTLILTGEDSEVGQLPMADAKITALDGSSVVVNNAFVSGGVALAQRATLEDNTGQVAPTASGMAIPKVEPTPAIENAAVASIDESADTVTLAQIDASVAAGQALQLSDAAGQTCAAAPKGQDLTVVSVSGAAVSFSTDITSGDASASTNCVLSRAETYDLPACEAGDPPAVIYTRDPGLDMDVLMTCSEMGGEAAWRSVLTMGGVIFDSPDIAGFIAAIGSGLPGMYVLRLFGDAMSFSIPQLDIFPYQDVRILSTATGDSTLQIGALTVATSAFLTIGGHISLSTAFVYMAVSSQNIGTVSLHAGVAVALPDGQMATMSGQVPGTLVLEIDGSNVLTAEKPVGAETATFTSTISALAVHDTYAYQGGTLFLMPLSSNPGGDNQDGTNWYIDLCDAAGLSAVGCTSYDYTATQYTQGGRGGGVNGWGDMSCNIASWISSNTGWRNFIHLESEGSNLYGDSTGMSTNGYGSSSPVHPICAIRP